MNKNDHANISFVAMCLQSLHKIRFPWIENSKICKIKNWYTCFGKNVFQIHSINISKRKPYGRHVVYYKTGEMVKKHATTSNFALFSAYFQKYYFIYKYVFSVLFAKYFINNVKRDIKAHFMLYFKG